MTASTALLLEARRKAGLSQSELARRSGVPQPAISAYEAGKRRPSFDAALSLLQACGQPLVLVPASSPVDRSRADRRLREALALAEGLPRRRRRPRLEFPPLANCTTHNSVGGTQ